MAVKVYTDAEGSFQNFSDLDGKTYRYSIGRGGTLIVMESPRRSPSLEDAEVHHVFSPTGWTSVAGLEFGNSVTPDPALPAME